VPLDQTVQPPATWTGGCGLPRLSLPINYFDGLTPLNERRSADECEGCVAQPACEQVGEQVGQFGGQELVPALAQFVR
jgi:hypothetical protein